METELVRPGVISASLVMLFQVAGVVGLLLNRLLPATPWSGRGRLLLILALVGLGVAGATCAQQQSPHGLFAGGTVTVLLVGMIAGSRPAAASAHPGEHPFIA